MTAIFELHLPSETLAADELSEITGARVPTTDKAAALLYAAGQRKIVRPTK